MKFFVILICKIAAFAGHLLKRGSSFPGQLALKLDKKIISKIKIPENTIMVTGSNGKTSTTELIANMLSAHGYNVAYNYEGSNQTEGVTTLLIKNCNLFGKIKKDALVIESDERYLRHTCKYLKPKYIVVTNIYRDQMTRNGHPEIIYDIIKDGISDDVNLILNSDDPLSSMLGMNHKNVVYIGMAKNKYSTKECIDRYNDGVYCPNCKNKLTYDYHHFSQIGKYKCKNCGHKRINPKYEITNIDIDKGNIIINDKFKIHMTLNSFYNAYNTLFAFAICNELNLDNKITVKTLNNYFIKNDRVQNFKIGNTSVTLLTSKHENILCYNEHLKYIKRENKPCTVLILVDAISRKYFTSEMSWIWDIDFELLNSDNIKSIIIAGKYAHDLDIRMDYANIDKSKIIKTLDLDEMIEEIKKSKNKVYILTCFSDRMKILNRR